MDSKVDLTDMTVQELEDLLERAGEERYRGRQIFRWISKGIKDMDEMTDISKSLREKLKDVAYIGRMEMLKKLVSKNDGTAKYLFKLKDGNAVESVLMEYKHGLTVCISSQVGCRMGCIFCASAHAGFARNLTAGEMINQVTFIGEDAGRRIGNVVVMGIGEPLDNYDNLMKFLRIINSKEGINLGYRHITVSTCGLVPGILRFSGEGIPVNLSISLHAPNDAIRERLMPINKRYSIDKIMEACKIYTKATGRRITFEYVMLDGVNDSMDNALELAQRIKDLLCHVNLIPANSISGLGFKKSSREKMEAFRDLLEKHGIETTIRRELGTDIDAACGQLRRSSVSTG